MQGLIHWLQRNYLYPIAMWEVLIQDVFLNLFWWSHRFLRNVESGTVSLKREWEQAQVGPFNKFISSPKALAIKIISSNPVFKALKIRTVAEIKREIV